jgi:hypothetical protein
MSSDRTVFVLGAGASAPYGLPLGNQLFQHVIDDFSTDTAISSDFLNAAPFNQKNIDGFIYALRYSGFTSVDEFLEKRQEFVEIGKAIMAIELLTREKGDPLWAAERNWMRFLYGKMATTKLEDFGSRNPVSFITYNYDRILEYFFHTSLMNGYGKNSEECKEALKPVDVIHLHGRLGYLPWQGGRNVVPFGEAPITPQVLDMCQREIRIVHETIEDRDTEFGAARRLLWDAKRIYFMGYGYAHQNVERLKLVEAKPQICEGTGLDLTPKEMSSISLLTGNKVTLQNMDCLTFLHERVDWN